MKIFLFGLALIATVQADIKIQRFRGDRDDRQGRQAQPEDGAVDFGVNFDKCVEDEETGLCCVETEETVVSLQKDPILECTHKTVEKCHYTYKTVFTTAQEEVCDENFEKSCQITFKVQAFEEEVKKCYRPLIKTCEGKGEETCSTQYETACTTKYVKDADGHFFGDTKCEKLPVKICGKGCVTSEGEEECHDKTITSTVDVPEETCDLNPQQTCRLETKLVPKLSPSKECTVIPQESCHLKFSQAKPVDKPLKSKWCLESSNVGSQASASEVVREILPSYGSSQQFFAQEAADNYGGVRDRQF